AQVAVRVRRELLEQLLDARRVRLEQRDIRGFVVAEEQIEIDRLLEAPKQRPRARRKRVQPVLGEIDAQSLEQRVARHHRGDEDERQQRERRIADLASLCPAHVSRPSSTRGRWYWRRAQARSAARSRRGRARRSRLS